jgi:hypothetical protein
MRTINRVRQVRCTSGPSAGWTATMRQRDRCQTFLAGTGRQIDVLLCLLQKRSRRYATL